jgi:hypothetical protein
MAISVYGNQRPAAITQAISSRFWQIGAMLPIFLILQIGAMLPIFLDFADRRDASYLSRFCR